MIGKDVDLDFAVEFWLAAHPAGNHGLKQRACRMPSAGPAGL